MKVFPAPLATTPPRDTFNSSAFAGSPQMLQKVLQV